MTPPRLRRGFRKFATQPDWVLDGKLLVWNRPNRQSIDIGNLIELEGYSNPFVPRLASSDARQIIRAVKLVNATSPAALRQSLIKSCRDLDVARTYLKIA
jgi:hypothetical protein